MPLEDIDITELQLAAAADSTILLAAEDSINLVLIIEKIDLFFQRMHSNPALVTETECDFYIHVQDRSKL